MLTVYIPSKGRSDRQITADQLRAAGVSFTFICSADDTKAHLNAYALSGSSLLTAKVKSISEKRQWILGNIIRGPKIVMLDDDLVFYARISDAKFVRASPKQLQAMFLWLDKALDKHAHAGIVDKFMSQATPRGDVRARRYNAVLAYNLGLWPKPRPKFRIPVSEEHDVHLQLAARGLAPIISTEWSKATSYYSAGGCADERSAKSEARGHRRFAELWPGIVSVIPHKSNISGLATRVRWSKALVK